MLGQYVPLDLSALDFLQIVIGAMTAAIAVFSALLLLSRDHDARMRALGLALFFLATAVSELDELYMHAGGYALHPWSIALAWPLIVIIGPAILLYVRDMTAAGRPPISPKRRAPKKAMAQMIAMTGASTHTISDGVAPRPAAQPSSPMKFSPPTGV